MLVEARDGRGLSAAMKGLGVRLARRVNAATDRRGRLLGERYHVRQLRTPTQVKHALHYVRHNRRHHLAESGIRLAPDWIDPCSSDGIKHRIPLPCPRTWLLAEGWQRGRSADPLRRVRRRADPASKERIP